MNPQSLKHGAFGGLSGGVVFGMMMGMMGMLPMIGQMVGFPSAVAGFAVHMVISAVIGVGFAVVLGGAVTGSVSGIGYGLVYGAAWWVLGPLTLMPLMMGMGLGANWNIEAAAGMVASLMGHLIYGAILGGVFAQLQGQAHRRQHPVTT